MRDYGGPNRRFVSAEIDPERNVALRADHPAVVEGRTLFPTTVVNPMESKRLFVGGENNSKLGGAVTKGPRKGWPIYQLSLEERATCPRSCEQWRTCYGAGMPMARRHRNDDMLIPVMKAELILLARAHPGGFLIRLHTLGDFYSVEYLQAWADMLDLLPPLHVFGYTARREDADDEESRRIARGIKWMTDQEWSRFAIRFSHPEPGPQHSIVRRRDPELADVVVCPAETQATESCASCGLCWAPAAREKSICFLLHGNARATGNSEKRAGRPRKPDFPALTLDQARALAPPKPAREKAPGRDPVERKPKMTVEPEEPTLPPLRADEPAYLTRARARLAVHDAPSARVLGLPIPERWRH